MAATLLSQNHLPQVASVVLAVVRADGCTLCEAMVWLAALAEAEACGFILYRLPGTARGKIHRATHDESVTLWRSLAARAQETSIDADPKMPSAASTWRLHLSGIRTLTGSDAVSAACRAELLKLVARRTTPAQRATEGEPMPAAEVGRAEPDGQGVVPSLATQAELTIGELELVAIERVALPAVDAEHAPGAGAAEFDRWVTPDELLPAFAPFLKAARFDKLEGWLLKARRSEGKPGRNGRSALFCPYAVMLGLTTKIRRTSSLPKIQGWHILREKFPDTYAAFEAQRPRTSPTDDE